MANFLIVALNAAAAAGATRSRTSWTRLNNTNLKDGDITKDDFSLPAGISDSDGCAACEAYCVAHDDCAAYVFVRTQHRCAIKGVHNRWCGPVVDTNTISAVKPSQGRIPPCAPSPAPSPPQPPPPFLTWNINWSAGGVVGPTDKYAVRAFDMVHWEGDGKWYMYCDLVEFSNPKCPSSFGSEIGCFSADTLDSEWTYHGICVPKNTSIADAGGLATPTAIAHDGVVSVMFAYEGLPAGDGLRGIGVAHATHPLGPFTRGPPVAVAPKGWHRPTGPGGIFDDPEVIYYGGRYHVFHSRKHVNDLNCSTDPTSPTAKVVDHCIEWRTSVDGNTWERRGVLAPPKIGDLIMDETMSARVYNDTLVIMTDGKGMEAFTTPAVGLTQDDPLKMEWSQGYEVNAYAGLNSSYVNVALRILPIDAAKPTHAAMGWKVEPQPTKQCHGQMTFAVFPLV